MTCEVFSVWKIWRINTFEDLVGIIWIKRGSKSNFELPWTKNTTNCEVEKWSSSVQTFHALTWRRKTATAAAEWRNPRSARVRRRRGTGSEALPHRRRWSSGGARVWEARAGERSSGVKEVRKGRGGIYSHGEKLFARRNWTNVPLTLLIRLTCFTHVLRSGDRVRSWVNR